MTRALEEQLGAPPPPGLASSLSEAELDRLARTIRAARRAQTEALAEAGGSSMRLIPALLRGPVKKIVGLR